MGTPEDVAAEKYFTPPETEVQCQICDKVCDGFEAVTHWYYTGHNLWKVILPERREEDNHRP